MGLAYWGYHNTHTSIPSTLGRFSVYSDGVRYCFPVWGLTTKIGNTLNTITKLAYFSNILKTKKVKSNEILSFSAPMSSGRSPRQAPMSFQPALYYWCIVHIHQDILLPSDRSFHKPWKPLDVYQEK